MEHFKIIQSLCRIGLGSQNPAFRHQVERLREALLVSGEERSATTLDRLLKAEQQQQTLRPSRVVASAARRSGEELSPRVQPPCDRETGAAIPQPTRFVSTSSVSATKQGSGYSLVGVVKRREACRHGRRTGHDMYAFWSSRHR